MLSGDSGGGAIRSTENDRNVHDTSRHVEGLGGGVDDVVNSLHREVECHELADGTETGHGGTDGDSSESHFGDWSIDDALIAVLFPQATRHLKQRERCDKCKDQHIHLEPSADDVRQSNDHRDCITKLPASGKSGCARWGTMSLTL